MAQDDIPVVVLRTAAARVREVAKAKAVAHGGTLTFAVKGRLVVEFPDGRRDDIGESSTTSVHLTQRVWKLR